MTVSIPDYTKLSVPERIKLMGEIWDSVVAERASVGPTSAQKAELDRRRKRAENGEAEWITWDEVAQTLQTGQ
jgi:putative addiction module component (TIGR02574 family)